MTNYEKVEFEKLRKNIEILEMELKVFRKENEELKKSLQFMIKHVADLRKENEKLKGKSMTREDELKDRIVAIIESSLCEFVREAKFIDGIMDEINLYTSDLRKDNEELTNAMATEFREMSKLCKRIQELEILIEQYKKGEVYYKAVQLIKRGE